MKTALQVAQEFNKEVLKGQLNPNGDAVKRLAEMIAECEDEAFQRGEEFVTLLDKLLKPATLNV